MAIKNGKTKRGRLAIRPCPPKRLGYATQVPKNDCLYRFQHNTMQDRIYVGGTDLADYGIAFVDRPA